MKHANFSTALLAAAIATPAFAQERDMHTDRPDATESAHTVDTGRGQLEVGFGWSRDTNGADAVESMSGPQIHFRYGLTDNSEFSIDFTPWNSVETGGDTEDSISDLMIAYKYNLWGNDNGEVSTLAIAPFIDLPTGDKFSSDHVTGGVFIPFELAPTVLQDAGLGLGFMLKAGVEWDEADNDYEGYLTHTAVIGLDITQDLNVFAEYEGTAHVDAAYESYFNTGASYTINADLTIDAAVGFGLNNDSEEIKVWGGLSKRF